MPSPLVADNRGPAQLALCRARPGSFVDEPALILIAADTRTRLTRVLVRLDLGRFLAPAQDAAPIIAALQTAGWHVRDVTLQDERPSVPCPIDGCSRPFGHDGGHR